LWELLTFKFVNPVMDIGITRQLDFTDLLELPTELRATSCYDKLMSSWTVEYQNHRDNSSLLRAMSYSYGWTYLRLGLLKVSFSFLFFSFLFFEVVELSKRMLLNVNSGIHGI
jgi:ATP-binding cassette subfamily C (CFTR/MRP) protein 10